jgi:hypothetical protein
MTLPSASTANHSFSGKIRKTYQGTKLFIILTKILPRYYDIEAFNASRKQGCDTDSTQSQTRDALSSARHVSRH